MGVGWVGVLGSKPIKPILNFLTKWTGLGLCLVNGHNSFEMHLYIFLFSLWSWDWVKTFALLRNSLRPLKEKNGHLESPVVQFTTHELKTAGLRLDRWKCRNYKNKPNPFSLCLPLFLSTTDVWGFCMEFRSIAQNVIYYILDVDRTSWILPCRSVHKNDIKSTVLRKGYGIGGYLPTFYAHFWLQMG